MTPFNYNIYTWTFSNWTMCDKSFYPTIKMCNIVTLWPTTRLEHPIPIYHLGVSLGTSSFTSSVIKNVIIKYVRHVNLLLKMNVQVTFGIIIYCFVQHPSYLLWYTLPSSTFIKSLYYYYYYYYYYFLLQVFGHLLCLGSFNNPKGLLAYKQAYLPITFSGVGFIPTIAIGPTAYLRNWAFIALIIHVRFMVDQCPFLFWSLSTSQQ